MTEQQERIAVIGCSGAGKSTVARALAAPSGLPVIHLDAEHWQPGWVEPDAAEWAARLAGFAAGPCWIIDGQYGRDLTARLARATLIVWLDLPTIVCLWGALRRWRAWRGRTRPDMGPDCPEKFDAAFLHWIACFRRRVRPAIVDAVASSDAALIRITSARQRCRLIDAVGRDGLTGAYGMARLASSRTEMS